MPNFIKPSTSRFTHHYMDETGEKRAEHVRNGIINIDMITEIDRRQYKNGLVALEICFDSRTTEWKFSTHDELMANLGALLQEGAA